jgi:hypothetical protein
MYLCIRKLCAPFTGVMAQADPDASKSFRFIGREMEGDVPLEGTHRRCGQEDGLKLFGISKTGLLAMTVSVVALWSCIALETAIRHQATMDALISIQTVERLRERSFPASEPVPRFPVSFPQSVQFPQSSL